MMLSAGENIMWVASQMGHVDTEIVMKTYGKWIPDNSLRLGYKPLNNWGAFFGEINPLEPRGLDECGKNTYKSTSYTVEAAGIEPATMGLLRIHEKQPKTMRNHANSGLSSCF